MKIVYALLLVLVGCRDQVKHINRTNWDYVREHDCVFAARFPADNYVLDGELKQGNPARTGYYCGPERQWVEVYDSELPRGVPPVTKAGGEPN